MTSVSKAVVAVLAVCVLAAGAGLAKAAEVPVPAQAVNEQVSAMVWIDIERLTPESLRATVQSIADRLPEGMAEFREPLLAGVEEQAEEISRVRQAFAGAGGKGVLIVIPGTLEADPMGMGPEPMMLIHTSPGVQPEAIANAIAEAQPEERPELTAYADGWLRVDEPGQAVIEDGEEAHAAVFRELLGQAGEAPIRISVRVTEQMKQEVREQGRHDPMMAGLVDSIEGLESGWTAVQLGERPAIDSRLNFETAEAATEFNATWEGVLMMMEGMAMAQLRQLPQAPDIDAVRGLFQSLKMQQQEASLALRLDEEFFGHAVEFVPAAMDMFMTMMMRNAFPADQWEPVEEEDGWQMF